MADPPKMKDAFAAIHGHFYQPPRENPWIEAVEAEESAHPFHDWNERVTFECYRPNAYARIVDDKGKILDLNNNYASLSFDFGPTLLSWLEEKSPVVYRKIIEADEEGIRRSGQGQAMAHTYDHIIMPLANERDKETEVLWGIADFEKRFHRKPEAMWLPETAVNYSTLRVLVRHGMKYLLLSPFQALRTRPLGGRKWTDVSQGRIDPTQPYRCLVKDESGKKYSNQFIDLFFYDGGISKEVAFGDLLKDGKAFSEQLAQAYQPSKERPQLIHIATDGETYGHHKKFGDMALAYALKEGIASKGLEIINYSGFLKRYSPVSEVEVDEGPKGEGTSWSCAHGVGRWKEDCGCSTGGKPGWDQKWRKPLREALDLLRDGLSTVFENEGKKIFKDVWEARNGYIDVILDRSPESLNRFFDRFGTKDLDGRGRIRGLKLLEMQRHALQMYASCGWFFADLAGIETVIILLRAARAIQLARDVAGKEFEEIFLDRLSEAKSNLPEMGKGDQVYQRLVKPRSVTPDKVVNHFALSSLLDGGDGEKKIFSYRVEKIHYEKLGEEKDLLMIGQVRITSEIIPEPKEFLFGLISSDKDIFRTWVSEFKDGLEFRILKEKSIGSREKDEEEMAKTLTSLLGDHVLTIRDICKEERQVFLRKLIENEVREHRRCYAELYDNTKETVEALAKEGLEIPYEICVAAEVTLADRLLRKIEDLRRDFEGTVERGEIDRIMGIARQHDYHLRVEKPVLILSGLLKEKMEDLKGMLAQSQSTLPEEAKLKSERVQGVIKLLDLAEKWGFALQKDEAQGLMNEMLKEYMESLEKSWWGESVEKPFPSNLILLAKKLNFNVERFLKMIAPTISKGRS
jgi:alpha-amylase/alpha-mannosidase (GH57 family)